MNVLAAREGVQKPLVLREVGHDAKLDLRVVGGDDHVARLGDECLPHRTALVGSHGNVLQVRIRTRQTPRHGDGLTEGRVHAAVLRVDHARELVEIGALELRETTVLENELRQRIVESELRQHLLVRRRRAGTRLLARGKPELGEEHLRELLGTRQIELMPRRLVGVGA